MKSRLFSVYSEKKKQTNKQTKKKKRKRHELNMTQWQMLSQIFYISLGMSYFADFCVSWESFYTQIKFSVNNTEIYTSFKYNGIDLNNSKWQIQDGGCFQFLFFNSKWRHYDITFFVKDHLCVSQLSWFYLRPYYLSIPGFLTTSLNKKDHSKADLTPGSKLVVSISASSVENDSNFRAFVH